ncbi:hypothetical protein amrb99_98000 [Actinomadura sp. RB99]|nr:hypothetical protein [Actinomadura sp. RB99]
MAWDGQTVPWPCATVAALGEVTGTADEPAIPADDGLTAEGRAAWRASIVNDLARAISDAEVRLTLGEAAHWSILGEDGRDRYRRSARHLLNSRTSLAVGGNLGTADVDGGDGR